MSPFTQKITNALPLHKKSSHTPSSTSNVAEQTTIYDSKSGLHKDNVNGSDDPISKEAIPTDVAPKVPSSPSSLPSISSRASIP